ncbi:MAG: ATP-dependent Clp protease adaptor ClpS [Sphingobacteriales bacterium]|jgi:ATP-dependent Clp protease adaptor protein ClpS|nr:ATP-dependent Clp protease adaptor ClpS [Sphingobacteriales bacterium]MBP9142809.1 ATP-dependent Clp protease adaptor ClpS [Chitinophagales bacterium]MDA0197359.1 ATP-dependent Clp protease adaptor ClpS [Bacteroidota bacterium]MBK6888691.1 ATP-dependent Clp protease adaptor ClpS [Sphingobacteriales bacterium]MBK7528802.1 ATP-dependent Clp protease adaptor ClpS [Sphingobacteriales bacterium]
MNRTLTREHQQEDFDILLNEDQGFWCKLIVHNDEVNTFEWVIQALIEVCKHTVQQAEQATMIIHFKGKFAVKQGDEATLRPMREGLIDRGINATIENFH